MVPDKGMTPSDTTIDYMMSSFQINLSSRFENKLLPNDLIIVRNHGYEEEDVGEEFEGAVDRQEQPSRVGGPIQVEFKSASEPRAAFSKNNTTATYGVHFRRSLYGWKGNFKELPMALVSGPNSLGVNRND
jgi:hypothetical protein